MKTSIEWCDEVWNPVWGCKNDCIYCYAHKIAMRFASKVAMNNTHLLCSAARMAEQLYNFEPTWIESNYQRMFSHKSKFIFVNSMSDICWWRSEWMIKVLNIIKSDPDRIYIMLTKRPEMIYNSIIGDNIGMANLCNLWLGISVSSQVDIDCRSPYLFKLVADKHIISVEPIHGSINFDHMPEWVIIGAETGNRKNKIIPKREWIEHIVAQCLDNNIPVFLKDNIKNIWQDNLIQMFPVI